MKREFSRIDRLADQLQQELAVLIQREVKDPRLEAMITLSGVKLSKDLGYADVYFTFLLPPAKEEEGSNSQLTHQKIQENRQILQDAASFLRHRLGQEIKIRTLPQLRFHYDPTQVDGERITSLINQAIAEDKERSAKSDD